MMASEFEKNKERQDVFRRGGTIFFIVTTPKSNSVKIMLYDRICSGKLQQSNRTIQNKDHKHFIFANSRAGCLHDQHSTVIVFTT